MPDAYGHLRLWCQEVDVGGASDVVWASLGYFLAPWRDQTVDVAALGLGTLMEVFCVTTAEWSAGNLFLFCGCLAALLGSAADLRFRFVQTPRPCEGGSGLRVIALQVALESRSRFAVP